MAVHAVDFVEELFPERDLPILNIILEHRGVIFGGYLRDLFAGLEPNDIDATVYQKYAKDTLAKLSKLYRKPPFINKGVYIFTDKNRAARRAGISTGLRKLEIFISDNTTGGGDDPTKIDDIVDYFIGPTCDPDFNVNKLTDKRYQRKNIEGAILYDWSTGSKELDDIIEACRKRQATIVDEFIAAERLEKMSKKKEWTTLPFTPVCGGTGDVKYQE